MGTLRPACPLRVLAALVFGCSLAGGASAATTIDSSDFCVDDARFFFDVVLTDEGPETEVIFRIAADNPAFMTPNERIAVNFSSVDGSVTRLDPVVETFGTPDFDRWQDGPIPDFEISNEGGRSWRIRGSVGHGPEAFEPGDTLWGIGIRANTNLFLNDLPIEACVTEPVIVEVPATSSPPTIDGRIAPGEWRNAATLDLDYGEIRFSRDADRLYLLVNVLADTGDDPLAEGGGDQFWLYFDVDEDGHATAGLDLRYRLEAGTGNLRYQTVCDDCLFGFSPPVSRTFSARGEGFGCFIDDGSLSFALAPGGGIVQTCTEHRLWEVAIDAEEAALDDHSARLGYLVGSGSPLFNETHPSDLGDYSEFVTLNLEPVTPRPPVSLGGILPRLEITQVIQTPANDLDLVAGKPTAARVWDANGSTEPVYKYVFGTRGGIDLPGSPLLSFRSLSGFNSDPRDFGPGFVLPTSWHAGGSVDFTAAIKPAGGGVVWEAAATANFVPTRRPVFWTVPVRNTDTGSNVSQEPTDGYVTNSIATLASLAPIAEIDVVRRPVLEVEDLSSSDDLIELLRTYDQQTVLAWTLGLLFTGAAPFPLPEQITGFNASGFPAANNRTTLGSSDPAWLSGDGRVSWTSPSTTWGTTTYAHELNHNLDTDTSGSWGRHSCGAGPDSSWPYADADIQETGVFGVGSMFPSVDSGRLDLMATGTCSSANTTGTPRRSMSPYRWNRWLDLFRSDALSAQAVFASGFPATAMSGSGVVMATAGTAPVSSFYIRGRLYPDGSGEFTEILQQPGLPATGAGPDSHTVRTVDCSGGALSSNGITPVFVDAEGVPREFVTFDFILPADAGTCAIELSRSGEVIARREISPNPPTVELLSPNGGESLGGPHVISWQSSDADGDLLTFTLLYSPDNGATWQSIATGISSNHYEADFARLPGGDSARIRVLASDGGHTSQDDSDAPFTVEQQPPRPSIVTPSNGGIYGVGETVQLSGTGYDAFGKSVGADSLLWSVDGDTVGTGRNVDVILAEGEYAITLTAFGDDQLAASASVDITVAETGPIADAADSGDSRVDIAAAEAYVASGHLVCEITILSAERGLAKRSRIGCHVDFDDAESEATQGCDADGDGVLDGIYRLGNNGQCPVSDLGLNYRHSRRGGECTGGPAVSCGTREFTADGSSDEECDGTVDGVAAERCVVFLRSKLSSIASERDRQCSDAEDTCFGGVDPLTAQYGAFAYFEAMLPRHFDRAPDTNDGEAPDSIDEVRLIRLAE